MAFANYFCATYLSFQSPVVLMVFNRELSKNELRQLLIIQEFARNAHAESDSHDYSHILSVCRYSIRIAKKTEEMVDPFIIIAAALLHDIGKTNRVFGHIHGLLGGSLAEEFLDGLKVNSSCIEPICRAIVRHTPTSFIPPETSEEKIIFDADALDRLGLMGLLRGFIGKKGSMDQILTKYMEKRKDVYESLYFEASKEIGDVKSLELEAYISIFEKHLKERMESIEGIFKSEGLCKEDCIE